jgi:hypothetical protein
MTANFGMAATPRETGETGLGSFYSAARYLGQLPACFGDPLSMLADMILLFDKRELGGGDILLRTAYAILTLLNPVFESFEALSPNVVPLACDLAG